MKYELCLRIAMDRTHGLDGKVYSVHSVLRVLHSCNAVSLGGMITL